MILALKPNPIAQSCEGDRRGELPEGAAWRRSAGKEHGLFAWCLAEGYGGAADANRDTLVEPTELFAYLQKEMPATGGQVPSCRNCSCRMTGRRG